MIKQLIRNITLREKASSEKYCAYLRKRGVQIGQRVRFYSPSHTTLDLSCPWLISMGDDVLITHGVVILTHDYAWSVLKRLDCSGEILGAQSPVKIGNNVFIGMNAIITRGTTIGDNVVIGAGSVVTGNCESNSVYAGNPARKIMTIEQYRQKRRKLHLEEAKTLALEYRRRFGCNPPMEEFREYFTLFCTAEQASRISQFRKQMETCGNYDDCVAFMDANPTVFDSYEAFLAECFRQSDSCGEL